MNRYLSILLLAAAMSVGQWAQADVMVDFEPAGYVAGQSVHNLQPDGTAAVPAIANIHLDQQAWFIPRHAQATPPDEEVVDLSGSAISADAAHGKVWRISQGTEMGSLGGAPQSPHAGFTAGETGALDDAGRGPVDSNRFTASFDFKSATGTAQPGLLMSVTGASFDQRQGFMYIGDDGSGFDLTFYDTVGDSFNGTDLDLNLSYSDWHHIDLEILFNDGFASGTFGDTNAEGNDVVNLYVDNALVHTGTTWESYYAAVQNHAESISSLEFSRSSSSGVGGVIAGQLGGGLYFDNLAITSQPLVVPEPASVVLLLSAVVGGLLVRRVVKTQK